MAERFYANFPLHPGELILQGAEAHHLATVLRAQPGDSVVLFNGEGGEYPATVVSVQRKVIVFDVSERVEADRENRFFLEVAAALPKGDRGEFLVEKLTELGVTRFVPLKTCRSVVHPRVDRLERTVVEASKQCGRNQLMQIAPVTDADDYWRQPPSGSKRIIAHPGGNSATTAADAAYVAVGPEGGFTDEEIGAARAAAWEIINLGPRILRIETAAIALAAHCSLGSAVRA